MASATPAKETPPAIATTAALPVVLAAITMT
jgi:hypothetical protein